MDLTAVALRCRASTAWHRRGYSVIEHRRATRRGAEDRRRAFSDGAASVPVDGSAASVRCRQNCAWQGGTLAPHACPRVFRVVPPRTAASLTPTSERVVDPIEIALRRREVALRLEYISQRGVGVIRRGTEGR